MTYSAGFLRPSQLVVCALHRHPLSFPVPTVLLGTRTGPGSGQFRPDTRSRLSSASLRRVLEVQDTLDAGNRRSLKGLTKSLLGRT